MKPLLTLIMSIVWITSGLAQDNTKPVNYINEEAREIGQKIEMQIAEIDEELDMIDKRIGKNRKKMTEEVSANVDSLKENRVELKRRLNQVANANEEKLEKLMEDMNGWLIEINEDTQEAIHIIRAEIDKATM